MSNAVTSYTLNFDRDLRERLRKLAKRMRVSSAKLISDACTEKATQLEKKFAEEDAARESERDRQKRLRPLAPAPLEVKRPAPEEARSDRLAAVFAEHARRIAGALNNPNERRLRTAEAIDAVKKAAPLTHPSDFEIATRLEDEILSLPALPTSTPAAPQAPPGSAAEIIERRLAGIAGNALGHVERVIDPSTIKTSGDTGENS